MDSSTRTNNKTYITDKRVSQEGDIQYFMKRPNKQKQQWIKLVNLSKEELQLVEKFEYKSWVNNERIIEQKLISKIPHAVVNNKHTTGEQCKPELKSKAELKYILKNILKQQPDSQNQLDPIKENLLKILQRKNLKQVQEQANKMQTEGSIEKEIKKAILKQDEKCYYFLVSWESGKQTPNRPADSWVPAEKLLVRDRSKLFNYLRTNNSIDILEEIQENWELNQKKKQVKLE